MTLFSDRVLAFNLSLPQILPTPANISMLYPFSNDQIKKCMRNFYDTFYNDDTSRVFIFGINPGRFGAGITGVPFTDPIRLEGECGIQNDLKKRSELSSIFVYDVIRKFGGVRSFYDQFYITSICPIGFTKNGKNYNYYDDKKLQTSLEPFILKSISNQLLIGSNRDIAICMGQGKNFKYFQKINQQHRFFKKIVPLPHPRWVMQYRSKMKDEFIDKYLKVLREATTS